LNDKEPTPRRGEAIRGRCAPGPGRRSSAVGEEDGAVKRAGIGGCSGGDCGDCGVCIEPVGDALLAPVAYCPVCG